MGKKHTEEAKAKMSIASKGNTYALGIKHTEEAKAKISAASKGNTRALGRKHTDEVKAKISATKYKPVINCRGQIFESLKAAAKAIGLKNASSIGRNIKGYLKSAGKYSDKTKITWNYYDKDK